MKKLLSIVLTIAMICSLFVITPVSAASSAVGSGELLFHADFDGVNPEAVHMDSNAVYELSDDGYALKITTADDGNGANMKKGAYFAVDSFTHSNALIKFDLKHSAGYHFHGSLWDSTGTHRTFRIKKDELTRDAWYTYIIDPYTVVGGQYVGYRKLKDSTTWEAANIIRFGDAGTTDAYTNTLKLGSGSVSSNNSGTWYLDNVSVFDGKPASMVIVPENVSTPNVNYLYNEDFNGATFGVSTAQQTVTDPADANNRVLAYDLSGSTTTGAYGGTVRTTEFTFPADGTPYTVKFDLRIESINANDNIWLQTRDASEYTCARIPMSQFEIGKWYTVSYTANGMGTATTTSGIVASTKILKETGESSKLTMSAATGWTGQVDKVCITTYNSGGVNYKIDETTGTTPWANVKYYIDNLSFSYESAKSIDAEILTTETTGAVKAVIAAYDENGVLTATTEADANKIEEIADFGGYASASFDIANEIKAFEDADSVKVFTWDSIENAKAYADAVEIGDNISAGSATSTTVAKEIEITEEMIPAGATGNYTVAAYKVPFTVVENSIPAYDGLKHEIMALAQSNNAISSITVDANAYNGAEEDIVIVCNADGATAPVVTLYEENDAPQFKNVAMLLGKDITERNFTWFSLDNGAGKITYQKKADMVNGQFTSEAAVSEATRCHDDNVFSTKEYYYQNEAEMVGLEPGETYVYQLSNGSSKSDMYTIKIGEKSTSFSFAFSGDPQVGGNDYADYALEHVYMAKSVKQLTTAPEFEGIDFFLSAGDQVESATTVPDIEAQYDIYLEHDEWKTFPMAVTLGNHDAKAAGMHMQHFNEPNMIINPETGRPYGESGGEYVDGADYYFVYNSVLFMHLNLNTFDDNSNSLPNLTGDAHTKQWNINREDDKADAEEHAAFIKAVLEETKDNKDILWTIAYCHQSPFGGSYHGNYTKKSNGSYSRAEQYDYINIREFLTPYLYEAGVDMVLSGHDHTYTRTHVIKPNENDDIIGDELNSMVITPYTDGNYTFADGTTTPKFTSWTDKSKNVWDGSSENRPYLKVSSVPVKVTDPDGFVWVTGSSSSGSQVNGAEYPNHYAAVCQQINQRSMIRFDVTASSLKMTTYSMGTNEIIYDPMTVIDEFEIVKTGAVAVGGVSLDDAATIAVGQTKALNATLSPVEPTNNNVVWASDNNSVATVDANGVVTAISAGTANITVTTEDGGYTATCAVTVVDAVAVESITLPATETMMALTTKTLSATIAPEGATTKALKWTSSDESIATVDQKGNVTAHLNGEVTITATATDGSGASASCVITVTYIPLSKLELDASSITMKVMDTAALGVTYAPSNATFKDIIWTSSAPEVVSVDRNGNLEAFRVGTAVITASNAAGETASCTVTSTGSVNFVEDFEDDELNLETTDMWDFVTEDGNRVYEYTGSKQTSFSNLNNYLASAMYKTPIADGEHTISFDYKKMAEGGYPAIEIKTYTHDGVFGGVRFVVSDLAVGEWYNVKLVYTKEGGWVKYYKKTTDAEYTVQRGDIAYAPTNHTSGIYFDRFYLAPWIAKASNDMNNGSDNSAAARLANGQKTKFRFDNLKFVTSIPVTGIALAEHSANLEIGETATINASLAPNDATDLNVTYITSDANIATVDRFGKVTAVGAGSATISVIAADGGHTATYAVNVKAIVPEISVVKNGTVFTVTTNVAVNGTKVYVAAYDAANRVIAVGSGDYKADGTEVMLDASASYYKAFIWGTDSAPVILEKQFN